MTRLEIGELYFTQGGVLGRRFLGSTLYMAQQIIGGGYENPTAEQTAFANAVIAATDVVPLSNPALKWGIQNNATLQTSGNAVTDGDVDFIVAEYAKTYA